MTLLLCHWRERDREIKRRREKEKERGTDGETLRWTAIECSCMCVVTHTCVFNGCQKKSGTTDITPSAERRRGEEEKRERGQSREKRGEGRN